MARKFVTSKDLTLIHKWNDELIQAWVGQTIIYYAIVPEATEVHDVYGEAIRKTWAPPVQVNALVNYDNANTATTGLGPDSKYSLEVYCHAEELVERNLKPREGDFVEFAQVFFEITSVTQPQLVFGQANDRLMTKLICVPAREGQFAAGSDTEELDDRSHPIGPRPPRSLGGT